MKKYYEVNTVDTFWRQILTSNTFDDYKAAQEFYDSIGDDEKKELVLVDENNNHLKYLECNFKW